MDELNIIIERMKINIKDSAITEISVAEAWMLIKRITELQKMEDDYKKAVNDAFLDLMSATKKSLIDKPDTSLKE